MYIAIAEHPLDELTEVSFAKMPDLNAGLTQVLADGTNSYLYGVGRIGQYDTAMQYFGADGLGSVRQIYNNAGIVRKETRYDPCHMPTHSVKRTMRMHVSSGMC